MTATMRAIVRGAGGVSLGAVPRPVLVAADDVVVRVRTAGICRTDLLAAEGKLPVTAPRILGHEAAGVVEETGPCAGSFEAGMPVTFAPRISCAECAGCRAGSACFAPTFLGIHRDGVFAERVRVPARALVRVPSSMSPRLAAYVEPVAAALAVVNAGIEPGQRGLVHGKNRIAGLVLRVLRAKGFRDVQSVDSGAGARLPENAYDFAIETGASAAVLRELVPAVRPGGRIVLKSRLVEPVSLVLADVVAKDLVLAACSYGSFDEAVTLLSSGALEVEALLGASHPLESFSGVFAEARGSESKKLFFHVEE